MPTVSVLMPLYRPKPEHLKAALDSLFAQTHADWKALLLNQPWDYDLKGDLTEYLKDPRVTFVQSEVPRGIGPNWNACLPYADAPYIAYLFHDDLWEKHYLAKMLEALEKHPTAGFVSGNHTYLYEGEVRTIPLYDELQDFKNKHVRPGLHDRREFLFWWMERGLRPNVIGEPSFVMLRKSLIDQAGPFHETMKQFLDSEYWTRCLLYADWYYLEDMVGKFRVHPSGTSAQNEFAGKGIFERFDTFAMLIDRLPAKDRPRAKKALRKTFEQMIARYFERKKEGRTVSSEGSGGLKKFCLQHPILVAQAMLGYLLNKRKTTVADT